MCMGVWLCVCVCVCVRVRGLSGACVCLYKCSLQKLISCPSLFSANCSNRQPHRHLTQRRATAQTAVLRNHKMSHFPAIWPDSLLAFLLLLACKCWKSSRNWCWPEAIILKTLLICMNGLSLFPLSFTSMEELFSVTIQVKAQNFSLQQFAWSLFGWMYCCSCEEAHYLIYMLLCSLKSCSPWLAFCSCLHPYWSRLPSCFISYLSNSHYLRTLGTPWWKPLLCWLES